MYISSSSLSIFNLLSRRMLQYIITLYCKVQCFWCWRAQMMALTAVVHITVQSITKHQSTLHFPISEIVHIVLYIIVHCNCVLYCAVQYCWGFTFPLSALLSFWLSSAFGFPQLSAFLSFWLSSAFGLPQHLACLSTWLASPFGFRFSHIALLRHL